MARRKARPTTVVVSDVEVPFELLAGSCVEQWLTPAEIAKGRSEYESPTGVPAGVLVGLRARRRFVEARARFLADHGIHGDAVPDPLRFRAARPWSFDYLAANDPDRLAADLERLGLPPDWRPTPPAPGHRPR